MPWQPDRSFLTARGKCGPHPLSQRTQRQPPCPAQEGGFWEWPLGKLDGSSVSHTTFKERLWFM